MICFKWYPEITFVVFALIPQTEFMVSWMIVLPGLKLSLNCTWSILIAVKLAWLKTLETELYSKNGISSLSPHIFLYMYVFCTLSFFFFPIHSFYSLSISFFFFFYCPLLTYYYFYYLLLLLLQKLKIQEIRSLKTHANPCNSYTWMCSTRPKAQ